MALRISIALFLLAGTLLHCGRKDTETSYPDNTFRRVQASDGLTLRSGPDEKSKEVIRVPFRSHVRLLRTRNRDIKIDGRSGRRAFISWSPMMKHKMPKSEYQGWTYTWELGAVEMKIGPNLFRNFKSGCLGDGCYVCGSKVFNPDGIFVNSFDCHAPPEAGRWVARNGVLQACPGLRCDPARKPMYRFVVRGNKIAMECARKNCKENRMGGDSDKIVHWEVHDFQ